jgi:nucleoside-diphosphate-sugar epimerase
VFHLAARAGVRASTEKPREYLDTNGLGTLELLEQCRHHGIDRLVLASTSSLYGDHNEVPFTEDQPTDVPPSPYAASKKAAETMAATYTDLYGIHTPVFRYFTVYGPAGRTDMAMLRFVRWVVEEEPITVYGDGTQERDFTYVDDIARGTLLGRDVDGHEVINLGNDDPVELLEMIGLIEEELGKEADTTFETGHGADMEATWADTRKARKRLGWEPRVSLSDGIRRTVDWYRQHRGLASSISLGT